MDDPLHLIEVLAELHDGEDVDLLDLGPGSLALDGAAKSLSHEDEQLLVGLRAGLLRLARSRRDIPVGTDAALHAALDGAEFVARGEILTGRHRHLRNLLPSFAFLAVLPGSGRTEALRVADRAEQLLAGDS